MDIGDIISWIVVGAVAGIIAKMLMPGRDPGGCIITIVLGIVGAVLAGYLAHLLRISDETRAVGDRGFLTKVAFGVVGAVIILAVYRLIAGRRA
ncbi:MAG: GlsB/YeaQ/YmgE family stress response membrane protein [Pyrinomonadaceae bacterium]